LFYYSAVIQFLLILYKFFLARFSGACNPMALPKVSKNKNLAKPLYRPARWAGRVPTTKVLVAHGAKKLALNKLRVSVDGG
jgi:hypothetical protein